MINTGAARFSSTACTSAWAVFFFVDVVLLVSVITSPSRSVYFNEHPNEANCRVGASDIRKEKKNEIITFQVLGAKTKRTGKEETNATQPV